MKWVNPDMDKIFIPEILEFNLYLTLETNPG
jgi:hypothetical protein